MRSRNHVALPWLDLGETVDPGMIRAEGGRGIENPPRLAAQ